MASPNSHAASSAAAAASRPAHTLRLLDGFQIALGRRLNGNATAIGRVYETELPHTGGARSSALKLFVLPSNHADKRERLIKEAEIERGAGQDGHVSEEECLLIALQLLAGKEWQPVDDLLKEHSFSKLAQLKENEAVKDPKDIGKKLQSLLGLRLYVRCHRAVVQFGVLALDNLSKAVLLRSASWRGSRCPAAAVSVAKLDTILPTHERG
ncbi:unnamed protein product [Vitrella brassicaformis CCMP3155]|uniref:Uncharacterized protein n=1 Tax=Vitrella brassicaformis (strain CCMP3155) TaxID=1169540 RepID=A0A0G4EBW9_VITBC|nr:unnamed protein product [Vitrella brassicaformis CCMP3155]|eukprot:CEL92804.1 unnamed protein product [Vitrella brassicaformis CCMP3155]